MISEKLHGIKSEIYVLKKIEQKCRVRNNKRMSNEENRRNEKRESKILQRHNERINMPDLSKRL